MRAGDRARGEAHRATQAVAAKNGGGRLRADLDTVDHRQRNQVKIDTTATAVGRIVELDAIEHEQREIGIAAVDRDEAQSTFAASGGRIDPRHVAQQTQCIRHCLTFDLGAVDSTINRATDSAFRLQTAIAHSDRRHNSVLGCGHRRYEHQHPDGTTAGDTEHPISLG